MRRCVSSSWRAPIPYLSAQAGAGAPLAGEAILENVHPLAMFTGRDLLASMWSTLESTISLHIEAPGFCMLTRFPAAVPSLFSLFIFYERMMSGAPPFEL